MSKKLLSEAQIRRFQSLANLPVVNERKHGMEEYGHKEEGMYREDDHMEEMAHPKDKMEEDGHMEEDKHGMKEDEHMKEDMHDDAEEKEEMDMEPEMNAGGDLDLSEEEAQAIIELGKKLEAIMAAEEAGEDEPSDAEEPMDMPDLGEELMEALAGVDVQPSRKEVVEEVARRVARRLNEAKRAQRRLNRALGNK